MANGQPKPAFYVAVLLVVLGLVGLAVWQYGGVRSRRRSGAVSPDELKQLDGGGEAPRAWVVTTGKESKRVGASRLPVGKGIPSYKPMADRTVRLAINVWAGWSPIIYANNGFRPGKVWKSPDRKSTRLN